MKKVFLLVEGPTEVSFVDTVMAPHLPGLDLKPIRVTTRSEGARPYKGGSIAYPKFKRQIEILLRDPTASLVTTMLDYQGMNLDFPGRRVRNERTAQLRGEAVQAAMRADISSSRYDPFVLMHEFEALLFSMPEVIAEVLRHPRLKQPLMEIRSSKNEYAATPEEINDSAATSPSARIETLCAEKLGSKKAFQKTLHGPQIAEKIGLRVIAEQCPHFAGWIRKLEQMSSASQ